MKNSIFLRISIHCFLPLVAGALVYLFFRPGGLAGYSFPIADNGASRKTSWLWVTIPDLLWAYSLASALFLLADFTKIPFRWAALVILLLLLASEMIQLWLPESFTFDYWDLAATLLAFLLSMLYFKPRR